MTPGRADAQPPAAPYHSLTGEDRLLAAHFAGRPPGFYVEVGAYDGVEMSNTLHFERAGWRGILVEADPDLAAACARNRPGAATVHAAAVAPGGPPAVAFEICEDAPALSSLALAPGDLWRLEIQTGGRRVRRVEVPARTLDDILAEAGAPAVDFMTIDVEGHEWAVLQGLSLDRWQPEVLLVERNGPLPDRHLLGLIHRHGYVFTRRTGTNDWFLRAGPAAPARPGYRLWLWWRLYLLGAPPIAAKAAAKWLLVRLGLFRRAKSLLRR